MSWHRPNSPAGPITSGFGPRPPIPGAPDASRYHLGVDLRAGTYGVPHDIYAASAGRVTRIYQTPLGAWVLEMDHGGGVKTRYAHMFRDQIMAGVGQQLFGGQYIGASGKSGAPTVHLHFEVLINGTQVDPVPFLRARGVDLAVTNVNNPIPGPPSGPTQEEDDMTPEQAAQLDRIEQALKVPGQPYMYPAAISGQLTNALDRLINMAEDIRTVRRAQQVPDQPFDWAPATHNAVAQVIASLAGLQAAVGALEVGEVGEVSTEQLTAIVTAAAKEAVKGITLSGTVELSTPEEA